MATIAEELTCPVCLEFYKDPRLLPCHHSLCKACLVALRSKKENDSNCELQCPSCRHLFQAKDETHIESLPKNFTLASIVCKFQDSLKGDKVFPCDLCEEGQKGRAVKKCLQCQFNYCRMCLEQLHPKRGALANHKFVHIMDACREKNEHEESRSACSSSASENQSVDSQKDHQLRKEIYCMSCDEVCTVEDQSSIAGCHDHHETTEIQSAFSRKREEFECILARLMDEDLDLEKGLADISRLIETIQKTLEEKKIELDQKLRELVEEVESRKMSAENRMEEEMKRNITSLESRLCELKDLKAKTKLQIAAFSELSSFTNEDASIFLMKLKELQNGIGPLTGNYIKQANIGTECGSSLSFEQFVNEIIANAFGDISSSGRRLQVPDPKLAGTNTSPEQVSMTIQVTNNLQEGTLSADVKWVAINHVDHYEVSYFCDPEETVLRQNIAENRCRLTSLKWDSEYTITVTAYMPDGKTSFDSTVFKTDSNVQIPPDSNLAGLYMSSKQVSMAVTVTKVQQEGSMSADIEWVVIDQVDHYEVSYSCGPEETILRRNIAENRCRLTSLQWDSEYTITVTAYMPDGKTSFDSTVFKTDPKVKDTKPAIIDILPKSVKMAVKVTNVQKAGTLSADVEWAGYQADLYEVSYSCIPNETVVVKNITINRCRLTNLKWDSTYTIKVTSQLQDGTTVFDQQSFKTDPQVKCYPMAASEICNEKLVVMSSYNEFKASNRIQNGVAFNKIDEFSGIAFTPVLTENMHFWTMNIDLSIFQYVKKDEIFLDFGIVNYSKLGSCFGLTNNRAAYSCSISEKPTGMFRLNFETPDFVENRSYPLPLMLHKKAHFCYAFMYNQINRTFAVMDCLRQKVLHVFDNVRFPNNESPIFAICPYHNQMKMHVETKLDYNHCINEDVSLWMRKIIAF